MKKTHYCPVTSVFSNAVSTRLLNAFSMYTSICKLSDLGLHQVNSVGLHEDLTRNLHVEEGENSFDNAVNCQEYLVSLENEIWSNGVVIQRKHM
jgi:hypothetical protein